MLPMLFNMKHSVCSMQNETGGDNRLIFIQTWFDFWFIIILVTLLMMLVKENAIRRLRGGIIFGYALLQIFIPIYFFFNIWPSGRFEFTPHGLLVFIGDRKICVEWTKLLLVGTFIR